MNLFREYIRELLTEAAKGPQDLPDGIWVQIKEDDWGVEVGYVNKLGKVVKHRGAGPVNGLVMVENLPEGDVKHLGRCGNAWMIGSSQAAPGWGPMLYDVAMEYATMKGGGIMADRGAVSPEARNVWDYYMNNRGDVTGIQMDDLKNTLTPEEEDNCNQRVGSFDNRAQQDQSKLSPTGTYKTDWIDSPLSKRWTKPPTTIEALRAAGKLVWHEAGDHLPIRDLDEEGPIIHLEKYIRELLKEDPMGFVHDLAAASEEFGLPDIEKGGDATLPFFGGDPGFGGGKAIKRAFNANADHQWLSTLDTVHWVEDAYSLEGLVGKSKDELSTTMTLPGDNLKGLPGMKIGLWVKGRITLAANNHDELYSGKHGTYTALARDFPNTSAGKKQIQQAKSSGINKRPMVSKDYSRYGNLKRGTEFGERAAKNIPYVLDQSTWNPTDVNEALVDNWKPVGIIVGKWLQPIKLSIQSLSDDEFKDSAGVNAPGVIGKIFKLAVEFGVPIYDRGRNELWSPE